MRLAPVAYLVKPPDLEQADDATLAQAAATLDQHAIDVVWDRFAPQVRGLLRRCVGQDGVEDLLQDVFLRFVQSVTTLRDPAALRGFLIGIAVKVAMTELRRRRVRRWVGLFTTDAPPEPPAPTRDDDGREALQRLYQVLDRVDPQTRLLFSLRHIEGMDLKEVAAALDVSLATVKRKLTLADRRVHTLARRDERLAEYLNQTTEGDRHGS
ncbi:MAG TPA: sigma-70 family RNA polymerase sigma factor [Polyangiaceae bacterium]|nr:sigma-70 family RNA polymerase sigma factor [Polyangiaceae bacterium]